MPAEDLQALRRIARRRHCKVADLVREAVRYECQRGPVLGPVALRDGEFRGSSTDHDAAFDDP